MSQYNKLQVFTSLQETGMVPVFYHQDLETVQEVVRACHLAGVRAFEFTNRGDRAHLLFRDLVPFVQAQCPGLILGVGSIIDAPTAALYLQLGANFVVAPYFNQEVARLCNRRMVLYVPGCGSVKEIGDAQEMGCGMVKIFPAGCVGGPSFVKNVKAPMPWTHIMATGAVEPTQENLTAWFKAGVTCVGMGSQLFSKEDLANKNWEGIAQKCRRALDFISQAR